MRFDKSRLLLYAVTDQKWVGKQSIYEQVEDTLQAGATLLQIREKKLGDRDFLEEAKRMKELANHYQVPLIINDQVEVAVAVGADGIHVGQSDMEAGNVRAMIGPDKILGVTAKTVEQALLAQQQGADYLGVGAVFGSTTKTDTSTMEMETLQAICQAVSIPVVAIGGIESSNIMKLAGSGVCGVAVVSAIFGASDIQRATRELLEQSKKIVGKLG